MPRLSKIGAAALAAFGWTGLQTVNASYLIVAGGGGGGSNTSSDWGAGGGGAGGFLTGTISLNPTQSYTVTVGAGGSGSTSNGSNGTQGSNSSFSVVATAAVGGGYGGSRNTGFQNGGNGGSGGGVGNGSTSNVAGTGTSGQGNAGGTITGAGESSGGGGGGASASGGTGSSSAGTGGAGGAGSASSISGSSVTYAGGGGGAGLNSAGAGGAGGGGAGGVGGTAGTAGTVNRGGGAGGGNTGGNGGSGVVIISYTGAQQFGGGVVTSSGGNTIHTFNTSGTLSPLNRLTANFLVVAGGGGGGAYNGGGGGAGGLRSSVTNTGGGGSLESSLTIDTNSTYLVTVGAGGSGQISSTQSVAGSNSSFLSITSVGGGRGGGYTGSFYSASTGGSGGGAPYAAGGPGAAGTTNQGFAGGNGDGSVNSGGGGGAGAVGGNATVSVGGNGGVGVAVAISGTSTFYAGGGGGAGFPGGGGSAGTGGNGGGGNGGANSSGTAGTANRGGGGGGSQDTATPPNNPGGNGGSGIVIISYAGSTPQMAGGTVTVAGGNVIHTFTSSGYLSPIVNVNNSLRFRSSASAYLNRTPTVAGNRRTFTWSGWVKRGNFGGAISLFHGFISGGFNGTYIWFRSDDTLQFYDLVGSTQVDLTTAGVFRDPSAWYHIVISCDSTQATASNRAAIYVNGVLQTLQTATYPSQNYQFGINNTTPQYIGANTTDNTGFRSYYDGYMTEINLIDGQALTPSSFGAFNGQGVWQPVRYGGSYGTNGFYLPFTGGSSFYGSFNGSNQYLQATLPATLTGAFTIETFAYRASSGTVTYFCLGDAQTSSGLEVYIGTSGTVLQVFGNNAQQISTTTTVPNNAWSHIAVTRDSSNVIRLFLNGVQVGGTWTYSTAISNTLRIGVEFYNGTLSSGGYWNGSMSNFRIVNGTALYTNTFTPSTSPLTAVSGTAILTLQSSTIIDNSGNSLSITNNNGVATAQAYPFTMIGNVSKDYSPQGNNWTNNNIGVLAGTTLDIMTDVPTNTSATVANYAVLNPLVKFYGGTASSIVDGNLRFVSNTSGVTESAFATQAMKSGKWYAEVLIAATATGQWIGVCTTTAFRESAFIGVRNPGYAYRVSSGNKCNNDNVGVAYAVSSTTNDIISIAMDADAGSITFYKNGVSLGVAFTSMTNDGGGWVFGGDSDPGGTLIFNFGQRPFAYTPPSGFVALNTFNLPTPTIGATPATTANKYFDVTTYTGIGSSLSVTNSGSMQPDFVWIKQRNGNGGQGWWDAVRGATKYLSSQNTDAEGTSSVGVTSFNSNGFTVGSDSWTGGNTATYVGWQWNAGGSTVTNTSGSISAQVRANTTAGFSVVTYTGNGTTSTVGHGLGVAPSMIIVKRRDAGGSGWSVYFTTLAAGNVLSLQSTNAASSSPNRFTTTLPTSTVFSIGTDSDLNASGGTYVAYCFAQVAGYSAFGSYTGNGSSDGPFVFCGFRPRFVMIKITSSTGNWDMLDTSRNPYNLTNFRLFAESNSAELTGAGIDILSNGFKIRNTDTSYNSSGATYIYMAFAESPFKYANAR